MFVSPPPGLSPLSPCRARLESALRGPAGINLGNLISGAVVPALNISISLGWLAVLELDLCWPAAGEVREVRREAGEVRREVRREGGRGGEEGGRGGVGCRGKTRV